MFKTIIFLLTLLFAAPHFGQTTKKGVKMEIKVESSAFKEGEMIPAKFTCDGSNVSPALKWSGAPSGTKSFLLITDDPDAPAGDWVHWILYNIPSDVNEIKENIAPEKKFSNGMMHGINDFRKYGYGGPCPPSGVHRYFFKLYALDITLKPEPGAVKKELLKAIEKHILAEGRLIGRYKRK
jgi:Raf kinase inhibitor-like YbhB/YbcL family protein